MKPMLACPAPEVLTFPYLASVKLDGIRCVIKDGRALTRTLEHVPNRYVQHMLGLDMFNGLDGELIVGPSYADNCMQTTQSGVMTASGEPDFIYHVFDYWNGPPGQPFHERYSTLQAALAQPPYSGHPRIVLLAQTLVYTVEQLTEMHELVLEAGHEGLIIRSCQGPYKFGRSTPKQGIMMKVKRFVSGEAVVLGCNELMNNENELETNEVGGAKRSSTKEGLVPGGLLGSLDVKDCESGVLFSIGSGFSLEERAQLWADHTQQPVTYTVMRSGGPEQRTMQPGEAVLGKLARYQHFEIGVKDKPRFPTFKGWRDARDMGEPKDQS